MAANKRLAAEIDAQESLICNCIAEKSAWCWCVFAYSAVTRLQIILLQLQWDATLSSYCFVGSRLSVLCIHSFSFTFSFSLFQCKYRSINYHGESNFSALLTPITFLISYFNSAFNPLLYAFLSRNFRKGMREIILCSFKKKNNKEQQRIPLHVSKSVFWQIFIERCRLIALKVNTHT